MMRSSSVVYFLGFLFDRLAMLVRSILESSSVSYRVVGSCPCFVDGLLLNIGTFDWVLLLTFYKSAGFATPL